MEPVVNNVVASVKMKAAPRIGMSIMSPKWLRNLTKKRVKSKSTSSSEEEENIDVSHQKGKGKLPCSDASLGPLPMGGRRAPLALMQGGVGTTHTKMTKELVSCLLL